MSDSVTISGIWLRRIGDKVQVLAEHTGRYGRHWFVVIEEHIDTNFSHIVEPTGILDAEIHSVTPRPDAAPGLV